MGVLLGSCSIACGNVTFTPPSDGANLDGGASPDSGSAGDALLRTWSPTTPLATARYAHAAVVYNDRVYVLGGDQGRGLQLNDVQVAPILSDGSLGNWSSTTSFPIVRAGLTSVAANGYLYVLGGGNTASEQIANVDYAPINPDGTVGMWRSTTPLPSPRQSFSAVVYGGRLYAIAGNYGRGGVNWQDVQMATFNADGSLGGWTALTPLPDPRSVHTSVAYNDYLYTIGGYISGAPGPENEVLVAPINSNGTIGSWTYSTPFPIPRGYHESVVVDGYLFVMGGGNNGSPYLSDVQTAPLLMDGSTGTWVTKTPLPDTRAGFASVVANGRIYVIGGLRSGPTLLNDIQVMTPSLP